MFSSCVRLCTFLFFLLDVHWEFGILLLYGTSNQRLSHVVFEWWGSTSHKCVWSCRIKHHFPSGKHISVFWPGSKLKADNGWEENRHHCRISRFFRGQYASCTPPPLDSLKDWNTGLSTHKVLRDVILRSLWIPQSAQNLDEDLAKLKSLLVFRMNVIFYQGLVTNNSLTVLLLWVNSCLDLILNCTQVTRIAESVQALLSHSIPSLSYNRNFLVIGRNYALMSSSASSEFVLQ